ncbi:MAG TPA: M28 family peptidase [Solirubrobacterales bacterium]|nr:M28 family peptidase [Solirubrobacterales bacterium]
MRIRCVVAGAVTMTLALAPAAAAAPQDSALLREGVTLEGTAEHMQKLQTIADAHQGNRAAGTLGYEVSASYVSERLEDAGYDVDLVPFDFPAWTENATPELEQVSPTPTTYVAGTAEDSNSATVDFITIQFSGSGEVEAEVIPIDVVVPIGDSEPNTSTSGCEASDFPTAVEDNIALIQRGTCTFVEKLENAAEAGAAGVIMFNEGQTDPDGRFNAVAVAGPPYYELPAVFTSYEVGAALAEATDPVARIAVDATTTSRVQHNVIADSRWGDPNHKVVVGGHLDSVEAGPGINDNGSGVSAIVETGEEIAELKAFADAAVGATQAQVGAAQRAVQQAQTNLQTARDKLANAKRKVRRAKQALNKADGDNEIERAERKLRKAKAKRRRAREQRNEAREALAAAQREFVAAQLGVAVAQRLFPARNQLRLAFWGAEESGLIGSTQYVAQLTEAERDQIMLNLNFDMLASPNFTRGVYDGDTSDTPPPEDGAPEGSDVIEQVFLEYFASQGLPTVPAEFSGRSDYGPFIAQGIPAGGLFSGAEVPKTAAEVELFGGIEGEQLDPCYHEVCDTYESVFEFPQDTPTNPPPTDFSALDGNGARSLDQMADAVAHATYHFVTEPPLAPRARSAEQTAGLKRYGLAYRGDLPAR